MEVMYIELCRFQAKCTTRQPPRSRRRGGRWRFAPTPRLDALLCS